MSDIFLLKKFFHIILNKYQKYLIKKHKFQQIYIVYRNQHVNISLSGGTILKVLPGSYDAQIGKLRLNTSIV